MPAAFVTRNVPGTMILPWLCDARVTAAAVMKVVLRPALIVPMIYAE
jgi:hypothetical protein